jgi:hypothetical protein
VKENKNRKNEFLDNAEVVERRALMHNLQNTQSRLRACEKLLETAVQEKVKFMEGASWVCGKVLAESDRHNKKVQSLASELNARQHSFSGEANEEAYEHCLF